jgi:hypothetical protein
VRRRAGVASGRDTVSETWTCPEPPFVGTPTAIGDSVSTISGAVSPAARMNAIACPTGTSCPSLAETPPRTPSAGASISTVTLSVSTSISGSPFATCSPSALIQRSSFPVSWAIPSAGMITSVAMT